MDHKKTIIFLSLNLMLISLNVAAENIQKALSIQIFSISNSLYQLEIAESRQQLQTGLMGRTALFKNQGMLFIFPEFNRHGIWMRNMSIPLTVAWLNQDMTVTSVHKLYPCQEYNCPITNPSENSAYVVELSIDNSIKVGDTLIKVIN